jgi:hypothetical protein
MTLIMMTIIILDYKIVILVTFHDNYGDSKMMVIMIAMMMVAIKNMMIGTCETIFSCMRLMHMDMSPMPNRM